MDLYSSNYSFAIFGSPIPILFGFPFGFVRSKFIPAPKPRFWSFFRGMSATLLLHYPLESYRLFHFFGSPTNIPFSVILLYWYRRVLKFFVCYAIVLSVRLVPWSQFRCSYLHDNRVLVFPSFRKICCFFRPHYGNNGIIGVLILEIWGFYRSFKFLHTPLFRPRWNLYAFSFIKPRQYQKTSVIIIHSLGLDCLHTFFNVFIPSNK